MIFYHKNGDPSKYPTTRTDARRLKITRYNSGNLCPVCSDRGDTTYTRFTANKECIHCCRLAALEAYEETSGPDNLKDAVMTDIDHYWVPEMCSKAGHVGKRTLLNKCYACTGGPRVLPVQEVHPDLIVDRDSARAVGFKVYRTGAACRRGHTGFRYISNNGCVQCKEEKLK